MCGILGFAGSDEALGKRMADTIEHRGPDDWGVYTDTRFTFVNRRLAVIDLSPKGHQPMWTPNNELGIAYNGEVYNYRELREELEKRGEIFESESDTEVILRGYQVQGASFFSKMRGMWALAIYNPQKRQVLLARDPFGIKPLYYIKSGRHFAFSSEMKALNLYAQTNRMKFHFSSTGVASYFALGYSIHPYTVFEEIRKLEPGTYMEISLEHNTVKTTPYSWKNPSPKRTLEETLIDSVERHLVADVPVGVFLSGGVDSTLIALMLKELGQPLHAFTVSMEGRKDAEYARKIAQFSGLTHHVVELTAERLTEAYTEFMTHVDEPVADTAIIPSLALSKEARKFVTCVLTGEGGDELFFGYERYNTLHRLTRIQKNQGALEESLPRPVTGPWKSLARRLRLLEARARNDLLEAYLDVASIGAGKKYFSTVSREIRDALHGVRTMSALDEAYYLPDALLYKNDIATMAHSIEGRTPFLDRDVRAFALSIPVNEKYRAKVGKRPLRKLLESRLPKELIMEGKSGFSVPREMLLPIIENGMEETLRTLLDYGVHPFSHSFVTRLANPEYRRAVFASLPALPFALTVFARVVSQYDVANT